MSFQTNALTIPKVNCHHSQLSAANIEDAKNWLVLKAGIA
jgi:hypothetical protein